MKRSSQLLHDFIAALREEGADLPESDENTIGTLTDILDSELATGDPINFPDQARTAHTLWVTANEAFDPNWKEIT